MNTILKSFLFNFLPPGPLYLICGIFEKKTYHDMQRADDLSKRLKKRKKKTFAEELHWRFAPTTGCKGKFFSIHVHVVASDTELPWLYLCGKYHVKQNMTLINTCANKASRCNTFMIPSQFILIKQVCVHTSYTVIYCFVVKWVIAVRYRWERAAHNG